MIVIGGEVQSMPSPREQSYAELVGSNIRRIRRRKNLTQLQLSLRMSVDKSTVSRNEHGDGLVVNVIPEYARALGCSELDIMNVYGAVEPAALLDPISERAERIRSLSDKEQIEILNMIDALLNFRAAPCQRISA